MLIFDLFFRHHWFRARGWEARVRGAGGPVGQRASRTAGQRGSQPAACRRVCRRTDWWAGTRAGRQAGRRQKWMLLFKRRFEDTVDQTVQPPYVELDPRGLSGRNSSCSAMLNGIQPRTSRQLPWRFHFAIRLSTACTARWSDAKSITEMASASDT